MSAAPPEYNLIYTPNCNLLGLNLMEVAFMLMLHNKGELSSNAKDFLACAALLEAVGHGLVKIEPRKAGGKYVTNCYLVPIEDPVAVLSDHPDSLLKDVACAVGQKPGAIASKLHISSTKKTVIEWVRHLRGELNHLIEKLAVELENKGYLKTEKSFMSKKYILQDAGKEANTRIMDIVRETFYNSEVVNEFAINVTAIEKLVDHDLRAMKVNGQEVAKLKKRLEELFKDRPVHDCVAEQFGVFKTAIL